ncbi:Mur ligase family protein [Modestobacter sp. Leaf380]|uniref:Mur ligase family protein n=1 Tax=Modestobacter sp. Leaf380 TaxID=1736356 RepID=UPI0007003CF5|nr:UDP-N-acetylmuramoyl-L-alanyl-D-glutamate--2,6-diaminopimelate ligase [Modestobacter sp. Leaf380]KQS71492.1 UDP-N-acetylmuramyl peptide synthase [Modestobacter sp. Leaf380]
MLGTSGARTDPFAPPPDTPWSRVVARARAVAGPGVTTVGGPVDVVRGLVTDSRAVGPGSLLACVRGGRFDGHRYAAQAVAAGAVALVVDRPDRLPPDLGVPLLVVPAVRPLLGPLGALVAGDPARSLRLAAVTGSNGKTTTSTLLQAVLDRADGPCGLVSTVGASLGQRRRSTALTTPEAPELHRLLRWMVDQGATGAVVEASSIALDVGRLDALAVDVAVFTGFEEDHLDHHGTLEQYWAAKAALFAPDRAAAGVVVTDDPAGRRLADQARIPVTRVGSDADCDVRVLEWRTGEGGTEVLLAADGQTHRVRSAVLGRVHVGNLTAAWTAARVLGVDAADAAAGLARAVPPPGRNTLVGGPGGPTVLVDYAHTPAALAAAVQTARDLRPDGEVHLVLGARGARDRYKRQGLGVSARAADHVWLTNEGSHGEDPAAIVDELRVGLIGTRAHVRTEMDRRAAITGAVTAAGPQDVVLVVGRGHETLLQDAPGALDAGLAVPFSDVEVAGEALAGRTAEPLAC